MSDETEKWIEELLKLNDSDNHMTEKQSKILQSAVDVFAEKGYAAASTSEIAQRAGVAEGTIFRHFKTKKDLLISIIAPTMARFIAPFVLKGFAKVLDSPYERYEDFLRAVIRNRFEFIRNHGQVIKILLHEIPFQPELREQFKTHVAAKIFEKMEAIIVRFQEKGQIVALPPQAVMRVAASSVIGFLLTHLILDSDMPMDMNEEQEVELLVNFMMHGLGTGQ
jgi:AcrR family transcriptional regulator